MSFFHSTGPPPCHPFKLSSTVISLLSDVLWLLSLWLSMFYHIGCLSGARFFHEQREPWDLGAPGGAEVLFSPTYKKRTQHASKLPDHAEHPTPPSASCLGRQASACGPSPPHPGELGWVGRGRPDPSRKEFGSPIHWSSQEVIRSFASKVLRVLLKVHPLQCRQPGLAEHELWPFGVVEDSCRQHVRSLLASFPSDRYAALKQSFLCTWIAGADPLDHPSR